MKKCILLLAIVILAHFTMLPQSCLPEGITFTSQSQIDSFQINYPNCTEIEGNVSISGENISYLDSLIVLTAFHGILLVGDANYLGTQLINLSGLDSVTNIQGDLKIWGNDSLTSLIGLNSLNSVGGDISIWGTDALTDLSGMNNVTSIGGDLNIGYNDLLTSLDGLNNLDNNSINNLTIVGNPSLTDCHIESICEYLIAPNGRVRIHDNATGCNNPPEIADSCGISLTCLPYGDYYFHTQQEIDSFQSDYSNCQEIEGNMLISGNDIKNLTGLNIITSVGGNLGIFACDSLLNLTGLDNLQNIAGLLAIDGNQVMVDFTGLDILDEIGGNLYIGGYSYIPWGEYLLCYGNPALKNLNGLGNLETIAGGLNIHCNDSITDFSGLNSLIFVGGSFQFGGNESLTSVSGIENLNQIAGSLDIGITSHNIPLGNPSLNSLSGFSDIESIDGYQLSIVGCDSLTNLTGLDNVNLDSIQKLRIMYNDLLSTCEVESICEYLVKPGSSVVIINNADGCNNPEEVEEACETVSVEESGVRSLESGVLCRPNPFTASTTIEYELDKPETVRITFYNQFGEQVDVIEEYQPKGKQKVEWNAENLPAGIYYFRHQTGELAETGKIVKIE
jgi:hypothetical protein